MKHPIALPVAFLAGLLAGCGWFSDDEEIPVTAPAEVNEDAAPPGPVSRPGQEGPDAAPAGGNPPGDDPSGGEGRHPAPEGREGGDPQLVPPSEFAPRTEPSTQSDSPPAGTATQPADPGGAVPDNVRPRGEVVAAGALQINRQFLTADEIVRAAGPRLAALPPGISEPTFRRQAARIIREEVRRRVHAALVLAKAEKRLNDQQKQYIDERIEDYLRRRIAEAGGSRRKLEAALAEAGTSLEAELARRRRELTVQLYLRQRFGEAVVVTRRMLWNYYRRHRDRFRSPKKVQMQLVAAPWRKFVPAGSRRPSEAEERAARRKARQVIQAAEQALQKGRSFDTVVEKHSRGLRASAGGVWPLMEAGSFREEKVERVAFGLSEGEVSAPIETEEGFYIVKARRVVPGEEKTFREAQQQIHEELADAEHQRLVEEYYSRLYQEATLRRSKDFIAMAVQRAVKLYWKREPS